MTGERLTLTTEDQNLLERALMASTETLYEIEHDPHDHSREYIPLPGGWEVQTKGAGSSYRLLDKKTKERFSILSGKDWAPLQAFFTRFAHEVFAASRDERRALEARALSAESALAELRKQMLADEGQHREAVAAERERCAKIADARNSAHCEDDWEIGSAQSAEAIAAAIRAQGE